MPVPPRLLHRWCHDLSRLLAGHATRPVSVGFARLTVALLVCATCTLHRLALPLPGPATPASRHRRLRRWLANARVTVATCWDPLLPHLLASPQLPHHLTLVDDPTTHTDRAHLLTLGLLDHHRVLPLVWTVLPGNQPWPQSRATLRLALLARVARALAAAGQGERPVTLVVDAGEPSVELADACAGYGWTLLARLSCSAKETTQVRLANGSPGGVVIRLWELVPGRGMRRPRTWDAAIFLGHGGRQGQLTVWWPAPYAVPWVLWSSAPLPGRVAVRRYGRRMRIEATFAEWKRRGWQLEGSRLGAERLDRLLMGLALAQWWLTQLGQRSIRAGRRRRSDVGRRRTVSVVGLGRREVAERLATGRLVPRPFRWRGNVAVFSWYA